MADEPKRKKKKKGKKKAKKAEDPASETPIEQLDGFSEAGADLSAKDRCQRISNIAVLLAYDLVDKLRFWQKETLKLPDEEVAKRTEQLADSVERLREAYLSFADLEL